MKIEQLQNDINAVNKAADAVKVKIRKAIRKFLLDHELQEVDDTNQEGIDFRKLEHEGLKDLSFAPDHAIDEDETIVAVTIGNEGKVMLWSYDDDSSEMDDLFLTDKRLTMEDLLEVLKLVHLSVQ